MNQEEQTSLQEAKNILAGAPFDASGPRGKGYTSRSIEVPWSASHIKKGDTLLDIGLSLGSKDCIGMLLEAKNAYGVALEAADIIKPEAVKTRYPAEWLADILAVPIMIGDIRTMALPKERYDIVTCISTIEHIGFDAPSETVEGSAFERQRSKGEVNTKRAQDVNTRVLDAFRKTLKRGGRALITVPMGRGGPVVLRDSLGFYFAEWEYSDEDWKKLIGDARFAVEEELFFKNTPDGWTRIDSPKDLSGVTESEGSGNVGLALVSLVKN